MAMHDTHAGGESGEGGEEATGACLLLVEDSESLARGLARVDVAGVEFSWQGDAVDDNLSVGCCCCEEEEGAAEHTGTRAFYELYRGGVTQKRVLFKVSKFQGLSKDSPRTLQMPDFARPPKGLPLAANRLR